MKRYPLAAITITAIVGLLGGLTIKGCLSSKGIYVERYLDGRAIPFGGLLVNESGLGGLAYDAEADFKKLYKGIVEYGKVKGVFPDDPRSLVQFTKAWPESDRITADCYFSRDDQKSDAYSPSDDGFSYAWAYRSPRPDGSKKPVRAADGERDVWIWTEAYVRSNRRVFRDGTFKTQPEGHFLVLWSDGTIERVGLEDRVLVKESITSKVFHFRGEAGLPKNVEEANEHRPASGKWWPPEGDGKVSLPK